MQAVRCAISIKQVAGVSVGIEEIITTAKIVGPDIGVFCAEMHRIQIHAGKKIAPIISSLFDQGAAGGIGEYASDIAIEISSDAEVIGALKVQIHDMDWNGIRLLCT